MQAPRIETQALPPPPGIIGSLRMGFDAIAAHVAVILMPLALDLFLWLGPRVAVDRLAQAGIQWLGIQYANTGMKPADIQNTLESYTKFLQTSNMQAYNLLSLLRTYPVGVSSLMSGVMPTQTPWGTPMMVEISSLSQLLAFALLITVIGWMLGGLYFRWVAALAAPQAPGDIFPAPGRAVLQTVVYAVVWSVVCGVVGLPVTLLIFVLFAINSLLGQGVLLLLGFLSMWLIVPVFFSPHGMFIRKQNAFASILSGFQMTRFTLPTSSLFVLTVFLLGVGLNFLWSKPANDSWLVIVGIFGHAFITTALLASSFVYYDKMTTWLQLALDRLRAGMPGQQI